MITIEKMSENGIFERLTKKEIARLTKELDKLQKDLMGIRDMERLPDAVFIVDTKNEEIAVKEAIKLHIPIIGLIDTNCDPDFVDYPIPGNDDALKSIRFVASLITDSIIEGRKGYMETVGNNEQVNAVTAADSQQTRIDSAIEKPRQPVYEKTPSRENEGN